MMASKIQTSHMHCDLYFYVLGDETSHAYLFRGYLKIILKRWHVDYSSENHFKGTSDTAMILSP